MRQLREAGALTAELTGLSTAGTPWRGTDSVDIVPHGDGGLDDLDLEALVAALLGDPRRSSS